MKKLALFLAFMLIPCTAFGLEMLSDNALDEVTGQSGVSIAFDDIQLFLHVDSFAYIDCDGYSTNSNYGGTCESNTGGAFVIENFEMDLININMIGAAGAAAQYYEGSSGVTTAIYGNAWDELLVGDALGNLGALVSKSNWVNGDTITVTGTPFDLSSYHDHVYNNVAYSLDFEENGQTWYKFAGNQTVDNASALGYNPHNWSSSVYTRYSGALPLASASCGQIPLFYDYGRTDIYGCRLITGNNYTFGLNNYFNTNYLSTTATMHPQAITIDITGALPLHTSGLAKAADPGSKVTVGGVLIGLPTAEFHIQQMNIGALKFSADIYTDSGNNQSLNLITGSTFAASVKNNNADFGTIWLEGVTFTTFGGWMELAPTAYSYD